jgi:phage repressor protein C with HTH and peptisase S24 domain
MFRNLVSQRLSDIIEQFAEGNEKRFAESIGVKPAVINNYTKGKQQSKPGFEVLQKICDAYPSINIEWLINGRGQLLKGRSKPTERVLVTTQDTSNNVSVPVINRRAAANYLTGYQTQEYFEELDAINLPRAFVRGKQCYALQVAGDSMEPTLYDSDFVICQAVDRADWEYINDGEVCVVATQDRGLQVKRLRNRFVQGYVTCQSDNRKHLAFNLSAEELLEIWRVSWKLSANLADNSGLYDKLAEIESRLERVERLKGD